MRGSSSRRNEMVDRDRLLDVMRQRFDHRLVALVAGAGFGKSTLVRQAIADNVGEPRGIDVVIECTADDVHISEFGARLRALLDVEGMSSPDPVLGAAAIADAIALRSPIDVCVVVEDAHLLGGSTAWEFLRALLDRLPPNGHVLLATRTDPDLPLARLAARGQALLIDEAELSFTPDECTTLGAMRGVDLSSTPIAWPALAELEARGAGPRLRRSYLVQEVVGTMTPDARRLLGAIVVAEGADDVLASMLVGRPVNVEDELRGIPLVHVDDDGWVQPHDLWRQAIADLLSPEQQRHAQDLAAVTLASRGRHAQAIRLHSVAGNWTAAGRVALAALAIQPPAIDTPLLGKLLEDVPENERDHPGWQLAGALVTYERSLPAARTALERIAEHLDEARGLSGTERAGALVTTMFHLGTIGRRMADEDLLREVSDRLGPLAEQRHARALAVRASVRGFIAQIHGRCAEGLEALDDVDHGSISAEQSAHVLLMAGNLHLLDGRADRAAARYREAAAKTSGAVRLLADELHTTATWVAGRIDEAIDAERRCLETAERLGLTSRAAQFRAMLATMLVFANRIDEGRSALAELPVQMGSHSADSETRTLSLLTLALLALHDGERAIALTFLERIPEPDGNLQRAFFFPAATVVALLPERRASWSKVPARLVRDAVAYGLACASEGDSVVEDSSGRVRREPLIPAMLLPGPSKPTAKAPARMALGVLGPVVLEPVANPTPWRRSRVRELLAAIAILGPKPRDQVAELLWPEQAEGVASRNLRVTLSYLADAVEPERSRGGASSLLIANGTSLAISTVTVRLDLATFDECRMRARAAEQDNDPAGALDALSEGVRLWRGDIAADIEAEWIEDIRRQRRAQFVAMASRAGELALGQGEIDQALGFAGRVLDIDPAHERVGRLRAACLLAAGDRTAATIAIQSCLDRCDEFGVDPEAETIVLATRLGVI